MSKTMLSSRVVNTGSSGPESLCVCVERDASEGPLKDYVLSQVEQDLSKVLSYKIILMGDTAFQFCAIVYITL
jgi:hypothetical protein